MEFSWTSYVVPLKKSVEFCQAFFGVPPGILPVFLQEFLYSTPRNLSRVPPGIPSKFLQEILLTNFRTTSRNFSEVTVGIPKEFLQESIRMIYSRVPPRIPPCILLKIPLKSPRVPAGKFIEEFFQSCYRNSFEELRSFRVNMI